MKLSYLTAGILFISFFGLLSCEKTLTNVEIPDYTPKLVLHAFISPSDTVVKVHVGYTKKIYGEEIDYPKTLSVKVTLFDQDKMFVLSERDKDGFCSLKYQIVAGKEYKIIAQCAGYPEASGVCKVPDFKDIEISIDTNIINYNSSYSIYNDSLGTFEEFLDSTMEFKINVNFIDTQNESNYYNVWGVTTSFFKNDTIKNYLYYEDTKNSFNENSNKLISDYLVDGQTISITYKEFYTGDFNDSCYVNIKFEICVLNTDADYYKYHNSLTKYQGSDDIFTEFSPVYSNIKNGFGIFSSYIKYQKTIELINKNECGFE